MLVACMHNTSYKKNTVFFPIAFFPLSFASELENQI